MALTLASNAITFTDNTSLSSGIITAAQLSAGSVITSALASGAVTQSKLGNNIALTGPVFRAFANSTTSVGSGGSGTKITLGGLNYDTANCFSSSRFTPNVAGYYWISACVRFENVLAAEVAIFKNSGIHSLGNTSNAGVYHSFVSDIVYLNGINDYVEMYAFQSSGSPQTAGTQFTVTSGYTWMSGFLARSA